MKNNIFVDYVNDNEFKARIVVNEETDDKCYWHIYRAKTFSIDEDKNIVPYVVVSSIKTTIRKPENIPDEKIPVSQYKGEDLYYRWVEVLDHEPTQEEWDSYYPF